VVFLDDRVRPPASPAAREEGVLQAAQLA